MYSNPHRVLSILWDAKVCSRWKRDEVAKLRPETCSVQPAPSSLLLASHPTARRDVFGLGLGLHVRCILTLHLSSDHSQLILVALCLWYGSLSWLHFTSIWFNAELRYIALSTANQTKMRKISMQQQRIHTWAKSLCWDDCDHYLNVDLDDLLDPACHREAVRRFVWYHPWLLYIHDKLTTTCRHHSVFAKLHVWTVKGYSKDRDRRSTGQQQEHGR